MSANSDQPLAALGRRGATTLHPWARAALAVLGVAAVGAAVILLFFPPARETGGTALLIIGAVFLLLAVVGRLPKSMEVTGLALEYEQDEMADFISTIRGTDLDEDTVDELLKQLQQMSANGRVFKAAKKQAGETSETEPSGANDVPELTDSAPSAVRSVTDDDPAWLSMIQVKGDVVREQVVAQQSGRGRPPRVDFYIPTDDGVVVAERLQAWNRTTLGLVSQRLRRVFDNDQDVRLAIVTVPSAGREALEEWHRALGTDLRSRVVAATDDKAGAAEIVRQMKTLSK
ncbi:hypothetical protein ACFC14_07040 [Microbacterium sp. NPDC055988]|uniref:hypothetical protein n=1 Tax=Microbacterium sp. NPDC055988 TaxID=3345671 RepID=UPI0035E08B4D